ncbi:MAG: phosphotransferase [Pseudomonadota bacterium]
MTALIYNPRNAVTLSITRETYADRSAIIKTLSGNNRADTPVEWRVSDDQRHWNFWRREALVYNSEIDSLLSSSGVRLPQLFACTQQSRRIVLTLEDVQGRTGSTLSDADFEVMAYAWALGQAALSKHPHAWQHFASRRFLRTYSGSKPVNFALLDEDAAWAHPLLAEAWPRGLREDLGFLYAYRESLYAILERAARIPCHLDLWPNNMFIDPDGQLVLIDWGFFGLGAWGEDIGNFLPDAVFDGFVDAAHLDVLAERLLAAYHLGLRDAGVAVTLDSLRRNVYASAVKYIWLGPLLIERAHRAKHSSYGDQHLADAAAQYRERGAALQTICRWARAVL